MMYGNNLIKDPCACEVAAYIAGHTEYYPYLDVIIGSRRSQHKRPNSREDLEPCVVIGIQSSVSPGEHINSMSLTETHVIKQQIQACCGNHTRRKGGRNSFNVKTAF